MDFFLPFCKTYKNEFGVVIVLDISLKEGF